LFALVSTPGVSTATPYLIDSSLRGVGRVPSPVETTSGSLQAFRLNSEKQEMIGCVKLLLRAVVIVAACITLVLYLVFWCYDVQEYGLRPRTEQVLP
jgi:hypothetical protein